MVSLSIWIPTLDEHRGWVPDSSAFSILLKQIKFLEIMIKNCITTIMMMFFILGLSAQNVTSSPEYIKELTSNWTGERLKDGRPKVSDALLKRLKNVNIEEAWGFLRSKGYHNQYEGNWKMIHP